MTAPAISGSITTAIASATNVVSSTFSTSVANTIIVVASGCEAATPTAAAPTVTSVTGTGLSFAKRTSIAGTSNAGTSIEVWWALASSTFSGTISVNYSASFDDAGVQIFAVSGCNTSSPWDTSSSFPAKAWTQSSLPGTTGTLTRNQNNDLALCWLATNADNTSEAVAVTTSGVTWTRCTATTGYIGNFGAANDLLMQLCYAQFLASGTYTAPWGGDVAAAPTNYSYATIWDVLTADSSGTTTTSTVSEAGSATDTASTSASTFGAGVAESGTAVDLVTTQWTATASVTETGSTTDTASTSASVFGGSVTEAASATDTANTTASTFVGGVTETCGATDTAAASVVTSATVSDAVSASDATGGLWNTAATASEAGSPDWFADFTLGNPQSMANLGLTFTRSGSGATYFDGSGTLQTAAANTPRYDYGASPGTSPLGLLFEESRTNVIRNARCEGATAGSPTATNWINGWSGNGITTTLVGSGTENGIPFVELNFACASSLTANTALWFESTTLNAASSGQSWTGSVYLRLTAGTVPSTVVLVVKGRTSGGGANEEGDVTVTNAAVNGASLASQRLVNTYAMASASTAWVAFGLQLNTAGGTPINFTLRIGAPQLELGRFVTSPILPVAGTPAATTRSADACSGAVGSWYNSTVSSIAVEALKSTGALDSNFASPLELDDGTINNRFGFSVGSLSTSMRFIEAYTANTTDFASVLGSYTNAAVMTTAATIQTSSAAGALNGGTVQTAVPAHFVGSAITTMRVGGIVGSSSFNGYVRKVAYWGSGLSNTQLQSPQLRLTNDVTAGAYVGSGSVSETGTAADTLSAKWTTSATITESGSAADTVSSASTLAGSVSETGSAADAVNAAWTSSGTVAEPLTISDTPTATWTTSAPVTESGSASDLGSAIWTTSASITESGSAIDSTDAAQTTSAAVVETGSAVDTPAATWITSASVSESGSAADSADAITGNVSSIVETGSASDSATATWTGGAATGDAGSATDLPAAAWNTSAAITEIASATDSTSATLATSAAAGETGSAADLAAATQTASATVAENVTASDRTTVVEIASGTATEAGSATDTATVTIITSANVIETGSAADRSDTIAANTSSVGEAGSATDGVSAGLNTSATAIETASASDGVGASVQTAAAIGETIVASDSASATVILFAATSETVAANDNASVLSGNTASALETGNATDTSAAIGNWVTATVETLTASDSVSASVVTSASVAETGSASDADTGGNTITVAVTETGTASDSAAYARAAFAVIGETVAANDTTDARVVYFASVNETFLVVESLGTTLISGFPLGVRPGARVKVSAETRDVHIGAESREVHISAEERAARFGT